MSRQHLEEGFLVLDITNPFVGMYRIDRVFFVSIELSVQLQVHEVHSM